MKILQVSAEAAPFAKIGGLADMTGALPRAWVADGHEVIPILPLYGTIDREKFGITKTDHYVDGAAGRLDGVCRRLRRHASEERREVLLHPLQRVFRPQGHLRV